MKIKSKKIHNFDTYISHDENGKMVNFVVPGEAMIFEKLQLSCRIYDKVCDTLSDIAEMCYNHPN